MGANPSSEGGVFGGPPKTAIGMNHHEALRMLLDATTNISAARGASFDTALYAEADSGNQEAVQMLLDAGADINATWEAFSRNALYIAADSGNQEAK